MAKRRHQKTRRTSVSTSPPPTTPTLPIPLLLPPPPPDSMNHPILLASLGNPAPYNNTFHSAGHIVLTALATQLSLPPFTKSRAHAKGLISRLPPSSQQPPPLFPNLDPTILSTLLLWKSPVQMNVSGPAVAEAWRAFLKELPTQFAPADARLVVVHDELELGLGEVKVRRGGSARGHRGVKSVVQSVGEKWFVRVGVGIGRPVSREGGVIRDFVLRELGGGEKRRVEGGVGAVMKAVGEIARTG